jgi:tetratricopeptide (TPR) repeat protein
MKPEMKSSAGQSKDMGSALDCGGMGLSWNQPVRVLLAFLVLTAFLPTSSSGADGRKSAPRAATADSYLEKSSRLEKLYQERAARNPQDVEAFEGMAILQLRRADYARAIANYGRVLELAPGDRDARLGLARGRAYAGQYEAARESFQEIVREQPGDTDALEGLARAELWAGRPAEALAIFRGLAQQSPANADYAIGLAQAQMRLAQYADAHKTLTGFLAAHPRDCEAELGLAYLDLYQGRQTGALQRFNHLISKDPSDEEALLGNVRVAYYRGDLLYARRLAGSIVDDDPRNAEALLLLAEIERALHHAHEARMLLEHAETLAPGSADVRELGRSLEQDVRPTLHTSASFARESTPGNSPNPEDLSSFGYENTWGFVTLRRSESYLSIAYLPSQSPGGGIQGAVGPAQFLYRQTTYLTPRLTLRGGVGLVRFGPGELTGVAIESVPITSAGTRPLGFASASYSLSRKLTVDLTAGRSAVTYTPTAVRLGVMEDRVSAALDYRLNRHTEFRFEPFASEDATISYAHLTAANTPTPQTGDAVDRNRGAGAALTLDRKLLHKPALTLDVGYAGLAYGLAGGINKPYLGIFNPSFYQRHYLTTHIAGTIHGPLGYDFCSGSGVQQVERGTAIKPALLFNPAFTLKASSRLSLALGYTHYDSSQALGTLSGNAVKLTTDWKF